MIVNKTIEILKKNELYAKKMYGQNFIISANILENIVKVSGINKDYNVIEIGPGLGALTEYLANNANKVLAYEIDTNMVDILKETLSGKDNVKVINIDFLKANLEEDIKTHFNDDKEIKVVANIPYYITSPIIFKLIKEKSINEMYFMVQKELALRFTGKPKTKDYNALSVTIKYLANAKVEFNVPRNFFYPVPNVDSTLLSIKKIKNDYRLNNEPKFLEFVDNIFFNRRKTMVNNISCKYSNLNKENIEKELEKLSFHKSIRAEELELKEIISIYKSLFESE